MIGLTRIGNKSKRLTKEERLQLLQDFSDTSISFPELAQKFKVDVRTIYRWYHKFHKGGLV